MKIESFGKSDLGLRRANNEDAFWLGVDQTTFTVADGMGGAAAGELASQIFVETALEIFSQKRQRGAKRSVELVKETFLLANERILNHTKMNPQHQGMGCTAELITFNEDHFSLGHVGDSRTYLVRGGRLRQLTRDHSLIQEQIDQGLLTPEEARRHSLRHVILRAVGIDETLAVDLVEGRAIRGDLFLLCSDGLTDMVEDLSIQQILLSSLRLDQKVDRLIELANAAGGKDNITVVLCEVMD